MYTYNNFGQMNNSDLSFTTRSPEFQNTWQKQGFYKSSSLAASCNHDEELFKCSNPHTPAMQNLQNRIDSFENWNTRRVKAPASKLAEAGFFYIGKSDKVKCFYCNGGLQNWKYEQEPWFEHAKWYPNCEYLLRYKGMEYVHNIGSKFPNLDRPDINASSSSSNLSNSSNFEIPSTSSSPPRSPYVSSDSIFSSQLCLPRRLEQAMKKEVIKEAIAFAFDEDLIRKVVERKLRTETSEYTSLMSLIEDLQDAESTTSFPTSSSSYSLSDDESYEMMEYEEGPSYTEVYESNNFNQRNLSGPDQLIDVDKVDSFPSPHTPTAAFDQMTSLSRSANNTANTPTLSTKDIDDKIQRIIEEQTCKVCLDRQSNCILQPCNHMCCCVECASALTTCPICRAKINKILKVYID